MRSTAAILVLMYLGGQLAASQLYSQDTTSEQRQVKLWMQYYADKASRIEIRSDGDEPMALHLEPEPVLRWTNPVIGNGTTHGACFVWTRDGRAEVFGTVFSYIPSRSVDTSKRTVAFEFHSLSLQPLNAEREDAAFWYPKSAGIRPEPIPGAPEPAPSVPLRLVQMRSLARQFSASSGDGENQRELRLLTNPLYRNSQVTQKGLDGALFGFTTGTDPEVLLLIEARPTGSGPAWHYSIGRFSHLTLRVRHNNEEIWKYIPGGPGSGPRGPEHYYANMHGVIVRDAIISESAR